MREFTEDQAFAVFECFDAKRSGFIDFNGFVEKVA